MKPNILTVPATIYPFTIIVGYGVSVPSFRKHMSKLGVDDKVIDEMFDRPTSGRMLADPETKLVFVWTEKKHIDVLVHELAHVTFMILDSCGVSTQGEHDEPFCYLLGYLTRQCLGR